MAKRDKTDGAVTLVLGLFMLGFNILLCCPLWGGSNVEWHGHETHLLHCVSVGITALNSDLTANPDSSAYHITGETQTTKDGISFEKREALFHLEMQHADQMMQSFGTACATVVTAHGIMLVNMFASSPKDIIGWEKVRF